MVALAESESLNFNDFTPVIVFSGTNIVDEYRVGDPYQKFADAGVSQATITFMIPPAFRGLANGKLIISLNHCRTSGNGVIDMLLNGAAYRSHYADGPYWGFGIQDFEIPFSSLRLDQPNEFIIRLAGDSTGAYWLSDVSFALDADGNIVKYATTFHVDQNITGAVYDNVAVSNAYRADPYLLFNASGSKCSIRFFVPAELRSLAQGTLTIRLNHCRTSGNGVVDMNLNGSSYRSQYRDAPYWNFDVQDFPIPFSSLRMDGSLNSFDIILNTSQSNGYYWLSDARLSYSAELPAVTRANYDAYAKNWILLHRSNIAELNQIPRDDLSAWQFVQNAPAWFYLPWLPLSPTELGLMIRTFPTSFITSGFQVKALNEQAREFHSELLSTDIPRKNALRHAYWMALMTRQFSAKFADEFGNAHEYAHVDLTIEGPYDHVTDKINNAVGIELARANTSASCDGLVDGAWSRGELAWSKNFRVESGGQTADVFWQQPLNILAQNYNVIPDFNSWELATLAKHNITIPSKPPIHDEL